MRKFIDLSNQKFGRLSVISVAAGKPVRWICRCDCGNEKPVRGNDLWRGKTLSCGCLSTETRSKLGASHRVKTSIPHASRLYKTEYSAWASMISRCTNPTHKSYKNYGARGIGVCDRWINSFDNFLTDVGVKPRKSLSLDRMDNNKDYSPDNCHWTTSKVQMNNVRYNVKITIDGESNTVAHWCEFFGIARTTYECRIMKGESPQSAFMRPVRQKKASSAPAA